MLELTPPEEARPHKRRGQKCDWNTPESIVQAVRTCFGGPIDLDPCSNGSSLVDARWEISLPANGLTSSWAGADHIFVNPPFGEGLSRWVGRCVHARRDLGAEVILLLPGETATRWWQEMIFPTATSVCFPRGRIAYLEDGVPQKNPPMASAMVYWGEHPFRFSSAFRAFGVVLALGRNT